MLMTFVRYERVKWDSTTLKGITYVHLHYGTF